MEKGGINPPRIDLPAECNAPTNRLNGRRHTIASIKDAPKLDEHSTRSLQTSFSLTEDMAAILDGLNLDSNRITWDNVRETKMEDGCLTTTLCSTEL